MKWAFQLALYERAKTDARIHLVIGDVGATMFERFRQDLPERFFNAGLCEQSMVSMAAGMAMEGLRPVVYTITPFLIERAFEQIKLDVDQMNLPVGLVGYSDDQAGPTHQELKRHPEGIGDVTSLLKNVARFYPNTKADVSLTVANVNLDKPWFLSLTTAQ